MNKVLAFFGTILYVLFWLGPLQVWGCLYVRLLLPFRSWMNRKTNPAQAWSNGLRFWSAILFHGARILTRFDFRLEGNQPPPGNYLILSNHQGLADIPLLLAEFKTFGVRFVVKKELKYGYFNISPACRGGKFAFIDREGSGRTNIREIKGLALRCKEDGTSTIIFPEGTRTRDGAMGAYQSGGIRMYTKTNPVPIIPVAIDGFWKARTLYKLPFVLPNLVIRLKIGEPIPVEKWQGRLNEVVDEVRAWTVDTIDGWRRELDANPLPADRLTVEPVSK